MPALDLDAIAAAIEGIANSPVASSSTREPLSRDIGRRMLDGYVYVDELLRTHQSPFRYGGSAHLLELNHRVLCGITPQRREEFREHIAATVRHFYDHAAGADCFFDRINRTAHAPPITRAANVIQQIVSSPQLFIEGNQRTAVLVASFVLAEAGCAPLVLTAATFAPFTALTARSKAIDRTHWSAIFTAPLVEVRIERFVKRSLDPDFLLQGA